MEQLLATAAEWWWIAPAVVGAGAVSYGAVTAGRRRARRLEVDAARHEERAARAALAVAKAQVRSAQAEVLSARAQSSPAAPGAPSLDAARRVHAASRDAQRAAALHVRAAHVRTKVALQRYYASSKSDPLPQDRLVAADDALTARWMEYETDAAKALAFPQLLDGRHPATLAFLRAHREARRLRPATAQTRLTPAEFAQYAAAVRAAEVAFDDAERDAIATARGEPPRTPPRPTGSATTMLSDAASALGEAASAFTEAATDRLRTIRWREVLDGTLRGRSPAPGPQASSAPTDAVPPQAPPPVRPAGVWPVPSRTSKPSDSL